MLSLRLNGFKSDINLRSFAKRLSYVAEKLRLIFFAIRGFIGYKRNLEISSQHRKSRTKNEQNTHKRIKKRKIALSRKIKQKATNRAR